MRHSAQKIIASFLAIIVLANSLYFVLPERARAADASADGGANAVYKSCITTKTGAWVAAKVSGFLFDIVPKPGVSVDSGVDVWQQFWDDALGCLDALWKVLVKIAFNKFKKRLLDRLTDDTIAWISGQGGKPKFVTDFNSVLRGTADAALGDTVQELGAGKLCNTKLSLQLQLNLKTPNRFSDNVSCTLSQVVGNIAAFGDNFKNGSWIAYNELNSLQNNKYGLQLLASDELMKKQSQKSDVVKTETTSAKGFLSTKMCVKWSVVGQPQQEDGTMGPEIVLGTFSAANNNSLIDPEKPPATPPKEAAAKIESDYPASKIKKIECKPEDQKVTTPGETLATVLGNSFEHDNNALVNADDLTPYLSAIFDAAFNRLTKQGVRGLSRASQDLFSQSGKGQGPVPYSTSTRDKLYAGYGSQVIGTTTAQPNVSVVSTSSAYSLVSSTLKTIDATLTPLLTETQALYSFTQTTVSLLSTCETTKTSLKTQCATTADLLMKLSPIASDLSSTNATLTVIKRDLSTSIVKLGSPAITSDEVLAISANTQFYATQINDLVNKLNADKTILTSINIGAQYQTCLSTPITALYICPSGTATSTNSAIPTSAQFFTPF